MTFLSNGLIAVAAVVNAVAQGLERVATVARLTTLLPRLSIVSAATAFLGAYTVVTAAFLVLLSRATGLPFRSVVEVHFSRVLAGRASLTRRFRREPE